jgi:hypothetical protein
MNRNQIKPFYNTEVGYFECSEILAQLSSSQHADQMLVLFITTNVYEIKLIA